MNRYHLIDIRDRFKCNVAIHWPCNEHVLGWDLIYCQAIGPHDYHMDYNLFSFCTEEDRLLFNQQYELIKWKWREGYLQS